MATATTTVTDEVLRILNRRTKKGATDFELAEATGRSYESVSRARRRLASAGSVAPRGTRGSITVWGLSV